MSARQDAGLFIPFQSTLPARGSDRRRSIQAARQEKFQSTLPARGSDSQGIEWISAMSISIHAPREGERLYLVCQK